MTDLFIILKNGSLIGYLWLPQHARCSNMWGAPLLFFGYVLMMEAWAFSRSLFSKWYILAPVLMCLYWWRLRLLESDSELPIWANYDSERGDVEYPWRIFFVRELTSIFRVNNLN